MIHKVTDRRRIVHYNVLGLACLVTLCGINDFVQRDLSPASWRRQVDCMTCLTLCTSLPWCGHGSGEVIRVIWDDYYNTVHRECHRCRLLACAT